MKVSRSLNYTHNVETTLTGGRGKRTVSVLHRVWPEMYYINSAVAYVYNIGTQSIPYL